MSGEPPATGERVARLARKSALGALRLLALCLAILAIAGAPLLAALPGNFLLPEARTLVSRSLGKVLETIWTFLIGLGDGSSLNFRIGQTSWNFLELAPGFLLASFANTAIPGALGIGLGSFAGAAWRSRRRGVLDRAADFVLATPDFLLVLVLQAAAVRLAMGGIVRIPISADGSALSPIPLLVMAVYPFCLSFRAAAAESRAAALSDHVAYARSKGLDEGTVLRRHVGAGIFPRMEAELPGIVTFMQGNLFVVEFLFSIPGMARFLFTSAFAGPHNYYLRAEYQYGVVALSLAGSVLSCVLTWLALRGALHLARKALIHE